MTAARRTLKGHGLLWLGIGLLAAALALVVATALGSEYYPSEFTR